MDLDEVKVCLRGLLSSTAFSYNLHNLLGDFKRMTGLELPLFGHLHPIDFLNTLDDTVQLFGDSYNPDIMLIESRKSSHITSLVDRQKSFKSRYTNVPNMQKRLVVPEKIQKENKSPLNSQLENFENLKLKNIPTSFRNDYFVPKKYNELSTSKNYGIYNQITETEITDTLSNSSKTISDELIDSAFIEESEKLQYTTNDSCSSEDVLESDFSEEGKRASCCLVNNGIVNKFKKIIKNYPNGLWCCELPKLFQKEYNFPLDYREFGYTSLIQMVSELPDVFRFVRPGNEDWLLFDASVAPSPEEKKLVALQSAAKITANLNKLLCTSRESPADSGVELDNLLNVYKRMFGNSLDFQSMGFNDLKSLLQTWEGNLLNYLEVDGKTYVVPTKTTNQSPIHWREAIPPITEEDDIFAEIFPKEVVGPGESLLELDLTRHIAVGNVVKVSVADVWSPSKFYLQLNKYKTLLSQLMDDLQKFYNDHLNKYKMPDSTIRPMQICAGMYAPDPEVPEEWYRARIVRIINEKIVLINLLDYGTVTRIKKSQLRFLHRDFQTFPVQGFLAQLSGIAPTDTQNGDGKWPLSTCNKFLELVRVPSLDAEMVDIDFKKPCLTVNLFYQSDESTVSINQKLVLEKLAYMKEPSSEELLPSIEKLPNEESKLIEKKIVDDDVRERVNNNLSQLTDEFLDITDLGPTSFPSFKTMCLNEEDSSRLKSQSDVTVENLNYEFEEVPDLEFNLESKVADKTEEEKLMKENTKEVLDSTDNSKLSEEPENSYPRKTEPSNSNVHQSYDKMTQSFSGLNPPSLLPDPYPIHSSIHQSELEKKINALAMELLTTKPSIKQVGMINPALALKIATEMAEVSIAAQYSLVPPFGFNSSLENPFDSSVSSQTVKTSNESQSKNGSQTNKTNSTSVQNSTTKKKIKYKYVKEVQVGDKIIHLITIDTQMYFCVDEIVHEFTKITNGKMADKILRLGKVYMDYRVITKGIDEDVLKEIKSCELEFLKKLKTMKIYLIPAVRVVFYLRCLGSVNKTLEKAIINILTAKRS